MTNGEGVPSGAGYNGIKQLKALRATYHFPTFEYTKPKASERVRSDWSLDH